MRAFFFAAVLTTVAGCGGADYVPRPTFTLVLPAGQEQWKREIADGFVETLRAYGYESKIVRYESFDTESIVAAANEAPRGERAAISIVFTRREQVASVVDRLTSLKRDVITVGADDAMVSKAGHVGISAERTVYIWKIRISQLPTMPSRILFLFGNEPIKTERLQGSVYSRSSEGKEFRARFRELTDVTQEDLDWAELVVPVGEDAYLLASKSSTRDLFPITGADVVLNAIREGLVSHAITLEHYQVGVRTAQMARDYHLQSLRSPVNNLPCEEVDKASLQIHMDRRYKLPPTLRSE